MTQLAQLDAEATRHGVILDPAGFRRKRVLNSLLVGGPIVGSGYAAVYFWSQPPGWIELSSFLLFYVITGIGIGVGFHRLFTHQSFRPVRPVRFALMLAGSLAFQGSVIRWVADHRRHHRFSDGPWDPHSPYWYLDRPIRSRLLGFYHAHVGWIFDATTTSYRAYVPDLLKDPMARAMHAAYVPITLLSLLLPYVYGLVLAGPEAAFGCLLLGGFVRAAAFHQFVWGVTSVGHSFGSQESTTRDRSRNNALLAAVTFGEGWHNNHHANPRAAYNRYRWYQLDINGWIIRALGRLGLATDIVTTAECSGAGDHG